MAAAFSWPRVGEIDREAEERKRTEELSEDLKEVGPLLKSLLYFLLLRVFSHSLPTTTHCKLAW